MQRSTFLPLVTRRQTEDDRAWGRIGGARPPLPATAPLLFWFAGAIVLALVVLAVIPAPGALDDPNEGDQRPGLLVDVDEARGVAGLKLAGDPVGGVPVIVIFDRRISTPQRLQSFIGDVPGDVAVALVVSEPIDGQPRLPAGVRLVAGSGRRIATAVGMPQPRDGGAPVGYAVIDRDARVRYATLDPTYPEHAFEIDIIAGALR